jgi:hypothetical protein
MQVLSKSLRSLSAQFFGWAEAPLRLAEFSRLSLCFAVDAAAAIDFFG